MSAARPLLPCLLVLALLLGAPAAPVAAGPPCICWELDPGAAGSLDDLSGRTPEWVVEHALGRLDGQRPAVARMEVLRRALLALDAAPRALERFTRELLARAVDAAGSPGAAGAWAFFDAGYAMAALGQLGGDPVRDGYAWVAHAIALRPTDAQLELAAALITLMPRHPRGAAFEAHWARAQAGAANDPLLARNLERVRSQGRFLIEGRAPRSGGG